MTLVFAYSEVRTFFHHPKTEKEAKEMYEAMCKFNENNDCNGVFTKAVQLIPEILIDNVSDLKAWELELKALKNMTGEDILNNLEGEDKRKYEEILTGENLVKCDECGSNQDKEETVETVDDRILCYGCDAKRLEKENSN